MINADVVIAALREAGVLRLFGMPGGGSCADLIEACARGGLPFTLAHSETAAAFMASAQAEITGRPGACLATLGPGAACSINGAANASLERVPLILLTDCQSDSRFGHQNLPQQEMFAPLVKWTGRPSEHEVAEAMRCAIASATTGRPGPVHIDLSTAVTSADGDSAEIEVRAAPPVRHRLVDGRIGAGARPVMLIGLGARRNGIAEFCERRKIPALVTYKAKGVVPDDHPWFGGVMTNGSLEREILERATAFIAVGLDPVELLPRPWKYSQPFIAVNPWRLEQKYFPHAVESVGDVLEILDAMDLPASEWKSQDISPIARAQRDRMRPDGAGFRPHRVAEIAAGVYRGARATVDAGAHMFPVMALWPAFEPCGVLISNGLSTMGFALPSAIGAALLDRTRPVVAFTGDGGLLMCLAELRTAARENLRVRVIVFDDRDLTLIKMKQRQRGYRPAGVSMGALDWPCVAQGLGIEAREAADESSLERALRETAPIAGPVLIAAKIDPSTYDDIMQALRG